MQCAHPAVGGAPTRPGLHSRQDTARHIRPAPLPGSFGVGAGGWAEPGPFPCRCSYLAGSRGGWPPPPPPPAAAPAPPPGHWQGCGPSTGRQAGRRGAGDGGMPAGGAPPVGWRVCDEAAAQRAHTAQPCLQGSRHVDQVHGVGKDREVGGGAQAGCSGRMPAVQPSLRAHLLQAAPGPPSLQAAGLRLQRHHARRKARAAHLLSGAAAPVGRRDQEAGGRPVGVRGGKEVCKQLPYTRRIVWPGWRGSEEFKQWLMSSSSPFKRAHPSHSCGLGCAFPGRMHAWDLVLRPCCRDAIRCAIKGPPAAAWAALAADTRHRCALSTHASARPMLCSGSQHRPGY
jgi:hypothetical protein